MIQSKKPEGCRMLSLIRERRVDGTTVEERWSGRSLEEDRCCALSRGNPPPPLPSRRVVALPYMREFRSCRVSYVSNRLTYVFLLFYVRSVTGNSPLDPRRNGRDDIPCLCHPGWLAETKAQEQVQSPP